MNYGKNGKVENKDLQSTKLKHEHQNKRTSSNKYIISRKKIIGKKHKIDTTISMKLRYKN